MAEAPALLTFPPMIDCETSRFVLTHYGIAYRETPHIFPWVSVLALFRGGTPQVPLFFGERTLAGPRAIVDFFEPSRPAGQRLIPENRLLAAQVEADWNRFNGILAGSTAVLGYYHLLPARAIMIEPFCRGVPPFEGRVLRATYPALRGLFNLLLQLNPTHVGQALTQTRAIFDETARRLADGRQYLVGDRLTLADIGLAAASAPMLLPTNYGAPMPPLEAMPRDLQAIISELRRHATGAFVESIYRRHRLAG